MAQKHFTIELDENEVFAQQLALSSGQSLYEIQERARQLGLVFENQAAQKSQTLIVEPLTEEEKRLAEPLQTTEGMVRCGKLSLNYFANLVPSKRFPGFYTRELPPDDGRVRFFTPGGIKFPHEKKDET